MYVCPMWALLAALLALDVAPVAARPEPPLSLEQALALAREKDPFLLAARRQRDVDLAAVDVAGERPNPELRYERQKETPLDAIGLAQTIELGGKRGRRLAVAEAALAAGEAERERAEAVSAGATRRAFVALLSRQRRAEMAGEIARLADSARVRSAGA